MEDVAESDCEAACQSEAVAGMEKGSNFKGFKKKYWGRTFPKCFVVVTGPYQGNCHWNENPSAPYTNTKNRALCRSTADGAGQEENNQEEEAEGEGEGEGEPAPAPAPTSAPTPAPTLAPTSESEPSHFILSPDTGTCYMNGLQDIPEADCEAACAALGYSSYQTGSWGHSPGCFAVVSGQWAGACHWSSATGATSLPSTNRQLCVNEAVTSAPTPPPPPPTYAPTPPPPPCPEGLPDACCRMCNQVQAGNCRRTNGVEGGCENAWIPKGGFYSHCVIARNGKCHANFRGWDHCPYDVINADGSLPALSNWGNPSIAPWCEANGLPYNPGQWR